MNSSFLAGGTDYGFTDVFERGRDASLCCCVPFICSLYNSDENEQAIIQSFTTRYLKDGPTWFCVPCCPALYKTRLFHKIVLDSSQYVPLKDWSTDEVRIVSGPGKIKLSSPYDRVGQVTTKPSVPMNHFLRVTNQDSSVDIVVGPCMYTPKPYQTFGAPEQCITLQAAQYCFLYHRAKQSYRKVVGPATFIPDPYEDYIDRDAAGRPVRAAVFTPLNAYEVTKVQCLHVRSITDGSIRMISEPQRFIPDIDEVVIKVAPVVSLEINEFAVVLNNVSGERFIKKHDDASTRTFFLGPFDKFIDFQAPTGKTVQRLNMKNNRFSMQSTFRSADNVLMEVQMSLAYDICDVSHFCMIGDVYLTIMTDFLKSEVAKQVAVAEHRKVFSNIPQILQDVCERVAPDFFEAKGLKLISLQLGSITCANPTIQLVLDNYVKETTDRTNQMLKEKAESDLALERVSREIRVETETRKLVEIRQQNLVKEAQAQAEASAAEQRKIFEVIKEFAGADAKAVYQAMADVEKAKAMSKTIKNAYLVPENVGLKFKSPEHD
eukprot:ANDGO_01044.mRNA.1 hypothetical protein AURANDRAFT_71695